MSFSAHISIAATPTQIFAHYADATAWALWDPEVRAVSLPDGLRTGSSGWLKPRKGPRAKITVGAVDAPHHFTVTSRLPLCQMAFGHDLRDDGRQTAVTHSISFSGPLAALFRNLVGRGIAAGLPATLAGLKRACEQP